VRVRVRVCVRVRVHVRVRVCMYVCVCAYVCMCVHTHTYAHTHTHTRVCVCMCVCLCHSLCLGLHLCLYLCESCVSVSVRILKIKSVYSFLYVCLLACVFWLYNIQVSTHKLQTNPKQSSSQITGKIWSRQICRCDILSEIFCARPETLSQHVIIELMIFSSIKMLVFIWAVIYLCKEYDNGRIHEMRRTHL